jgi:hypothetical protein
MATDPFGGDSEPRGGERRADGSPVSVRNAAQAGKAPARADASQGLRNSGTAARGPDTSSPTAPGGRRPGRWLLVTCGLLAALGSLAWFGLPLLVEHYALKAVTAAERRLGVRLAARSVAWSWGGRARVEGLSVTTQAGEAIATVEQVDIDASVDLVELTLGLRRIEVRDAALAVTIGPDGASNLDGIIAGLGKRESGEGDGGGSATRLLRGRPPVVRAEGVRVVVSVDPSRLPRELALPAQFGLSGGRLELTPQPGVEEGYARAVFDLRLAFDDNTLDPGFGFSASAMAGIDAGLGRFGLEFTRPLRVRLGGRVAAVGAIGYDGGQRMIVARSVQLSQPLPSGPAPTSVAAAIELGRVTAGPVELPRLLRLAKSGAAGLGSALEMFERVSLESPMAVLDLDAPSLGFEDLLGSLGAGRLEAEGSAPAAPPGVAAVSADETEVEEKFKLGDKVAQALGAGIARLEKLFGGVRRRVESGLSRAPEVVLTGGLLKLHSSRGSVELSDLGLELGRDDETARARVATRVGALGAAETWAKERNAAAAVEAPTDPRGAFSLELSLVGRGEGGTGRVLTASLSARELSGAWLTPFLPPTTEDEPQRAELAPDGRVASARLAFDGVWGAEGDDEAPSGGSTRGARLERWEVSGQTSVAGLSLHIPGLSATPMRGLDGAIEGRLIHRPEDGLLSLEGLRVERRGVSVTGRADVSGVRALPAGGKGASEDAAAPRVRLALSLPPVDVQKLFDAFPPELVPALRQLRVQGTLGWELAVDLDTANPAALKEKGLVSEPSLKDFELETMGEVIDFGKLRDQHTYGIRAFDGTETTRLVGPNASGWVPLGWVSKFVVKAFNTTEDGTFWSNDGVAPFAIRESLIANLERGAFVRGGSTITQQLVKNLFLGGQKLIGRKLQELFIAWQMTKSMTKQEIMALYLNTIEFGPGVYGIGAAAYYWFGKRAADLTLPESVFLASIVPAPRRFQGMLAAGRASDGWRAHIASLIGIMVSRGHVSRAEVDALGEWQLTFRTHAGVASDEPTVDEQPEPEPVELWDGDLLTQPR